MRPWSFGSWASALAHTASLLCPVVVVVERIEEVLAEGDPAQVRAFADALLALVRSPGAGHRVIVASDPSALARVKALGPFGLLLLKSQVLVTFTAAELRQMVLEPANRVGLHFDEGLVDRLLLDVQGDPAALALLRLLKNRPGRTAEPDSAPAQVIR